MPKKDKGGILMPEPQRDTNPERWLKEERVRLDKRINQFNVTAMELGEDVIVAFQMTLEEREEFLNDNQIQSDS